MQKNRLGQTDIFVSLLGLGCVKFGRNQSVKYKTAFSLPTDRSLIELLKVAESLGINLIDTAPAYGRSEERLGKLLKTQRKNWIISTKAGETFKDNQSFFDFSKLALIKSVERSLQKLNTDYLDILLIHSNGEDTAIIEQYEVFDTLLSLKHQGKLRAFGMSTKTLSGAMLTLQQADLAMITFNPEYTQEKEVIEYAYQQKKGIFIKKPLGSGYLSPKQAFPFILQQKGVSTIIVGTLNPQHLTENARCIVAEGR